MKPFRRRKCAPVWMGALTLFAAATLHAGSVDLIDPFDNDSGWTASWAPEFDGRIDVSVDFVLNDAVQVQIFKDFTEGPANGLVIEPMTIEFQQRDTATATRFIVIADELIFNNTGLPWIGYRFFLDGDASFDPDLSAGFTIDPFTTGEFVNGNTAFALSGGIVDDGGVFVPGALGEGLWIDARGDFSFHQQPIPIPLPMAALSGLSGLTLIGLLGRSRLRRLAGV